MNVNQTHGFSFGAFTWWTGRVVNRKDDPLKIGRVKVRIFGYHPEDDGLVPDDDLPWAMVMQPTTSAAMNEIGCSPTGVIEGTIVVGFFADGSNAQTPVVIGTLQGAPNGIPDSNKLARGDDLDDTIIQRKLDDRKESPPPDNHWWEPETPAAPEYPHNQMRMTESGIIEELDDTADAVRWARWHPSATFKETHPDGTTVEKIVKDNYSIVLGDDYCHIEGDCRVNIMGDARVVVEGNAYMRVAGNRDEIVEGNYNLRVDNNFTVQVGNVYSNTVGTWYNLRAPRVDIN